MVASATAIDKPGEAVSRPYRPDIDGLRAVAILLVVCSHIGVPFLRGGFVGVDVFFAISGYLITDLLIREYQRTGRIDIAGFYARRARRILPALGAMIGLTLLIGLAVLLPDELVALSQSAAASLAFSGNFFFWQTQQSYFADASALFPLQHLWTLSVEEQFYLAWPLVLLAIGAFASKRTWNVARAVACALCALVLISLALSVGLARRAPSAAFFLLPTRAWELGLGALLACAPVSRSRWAWSLASSGLAAIAAAAVLFSASTPFPSFFALLPVLGGVALLAASDMGADNPVTRCLKARPLAGLGKVSYGWYLWHWPLLVLTRIVWGSEPALLRNLIVALSALILAVASWRWLELPVRERRLQIVRSTRGALTSGAVLLTVLAALAGAAWAWGARPQPLGSVLAQYHAARRGAARDFPFCEDGRSGTCQVGDRTSATSILLWGDSHAAHLTTGLNIAARAAGLRIIVRTRGGCSPGGFPDAPPKSEAAFWDACDQFDQALIASLPSLVREQGLRGVMIAGTWLDQRTGWDFRLQGYTDQVQQLGIRVVLSGDVPIQPEGFISCAIRGVEAACAPPRAVVERQQPLSAAALIRLSTGRPNVRLWSPLDALCPAGRCPAVIDGQLLYRNRNHLTIAGSAQLASSMAPMLAWLAGEPAKR